MPAIIRQPSNPNFLAQTNFKFLLQRAPKVEYFISSVKLPGMSLEVAPQTNPFITIPWPGTKMEYERLDMTFRVDEDFGNYFEIYNWINALGFPDDFSGYPLLKDGDGVVSDASLMVLTSAKNPNLNIRFTNMFPVYLGGLEFDLEKDDIEYIECPVTFAYQRFYVEKLNASS